MQHLSQTHLKPTTVYATSSAMVRCFNKPNLFAARKTELLPCRENPLSPTGTSAMLSEEAALPMETLAFGLWSSSRLAH